MDFSEKSPKIFRDIEQGDLNAVKKYIEYGGDIKCECFVISWCQDVNLLLAAVMSNQQEIGSYLIDNGIDVSYSDHEALKLAARRGYNEILQKILVSPDSDPTSDQSLALRLAAAGNHKDVVKTLLNDPRVDPAACDNDALKIAVKFNKLEAALELLKDKRIDPTAENNHIVGYAIASDNPNMICAVLTEIKRRNPKFDIEFDLPEYMKKVPVFGLARCIFEQNKGET